MVAEVRRMGSSLARHTGGEEGEVIRHLIQRVAVVLARINAAMILNTKQGTISHIKPSRWGGVG